ncbi:MAG: helix-turn-helix domain-containing protein [Gaiellaceae bacterium]
MTAPDDAWKSQLEALGGFIRGQRQLAKLSLREMARLTDVSNAYLSQIERGLHQPSVRVLRSLADALNVSAETLLAQAGLIDDDEADPAGATDIPSGPARTVAAILADSSLTPEQREALLSVYRSFSTDQDA